MNNVETTGIHPTKTGSEPYLDRNDGTIDAETTRALDRLQNKIRDILFTVDLKIGGENPFKEKNEE